MRRLFTLALLLASLAHAGPRGRGAAEDPLLLAGLLVREGEWARAEATLDAIDPAARDLDHARYWTLRGLVALHDRRASEAVEAFTAALAAATEGRELLEIHLARAQLAAGAPEQALAALGRSGDVGAGMPATWLLRAQAHQDAGDPDGAWAALEEGAARFPAQAEMRRQQVFLLVRQGLYREARARGEALLRRDDADADDAVAISEALRRGGDTTEALTILEAALLEEGEDRDLLVQAARASLDAGLPRAAGRFLERAATLDPALALEAAEAYRRGNDLDAALRLNADVPEPLAKARQRLGLFIDAGAWDRAVSLEGRLERLGLGRDDGIRYGLAYSYFRLGDMPAAERWLGDISDPAAFRRATDLRRAIAACAEGGSCP